MRAGHRLSLISALVVISTCAGAQTPPSQWPTCMPEFGKLRGDLENRLIAIKTAIKRHATREEVCRDITGLVAAHIELVASIERKAASCGIPSGIPQQLRAAQVRDEQIRQIRERFCAAVPSLTGVPDGSLIPTPERTKSGPGNTLD